MVVVPTARVLEEISVNVRGCDYFDMAHGQGTGDFLGPSRAHLGHGCRELSLAHVPWKCR